MSIVRTGLTQAEAQRRLAAEGYNEVIAAPQRVWLQLLAKLWGPVPWMLEITIILTLVIGRVADAVIITFLLVFNAIIGFMQEHRADTALQLLHQRLTVMVRVLRDGQWQEIPAREVVRDDLLHVRMGDIIAADMRLLDGDLLLDQSPLTGESVPVERQAGETAFAGSLVKHGEASGAVIATGARTSFGRTAELVQRARTVSHLEAIVLTIVKYLVLVDSALVLIVLAVALWSHISLAVVLPFALMLLVASVPVALAATFTLTQALGAQELAHQNVLITHLPAIEEAASMDLLCTDKTGTITRNELRVGRVVAYPPATPDMVLLFGALASDAASQDPLDVAILAAAGEVARTGQRATEIQRTAFIPFDPERKRTEARIELEGTEQSVVKGAPQVVEELVAGSDTHAVGRDVEALASEGQRVLAVAAGPAGALRLLGCIGLADPPRPDSASLIERLRALGVRSLMLTGDTVETARAIAAQVGIGKRVCDADTLHALLKQAGEHDQAAIAGLAGDYDAIAGIFPDDKYHLVRALQSAGHVVGMTGDGVNDAPALKQAEVGIAVSSATDVAKAAASIVLTNPGLLDVLTAVGASRRIYQRMRTYTLNKIIKTMQVSLFLAGAFVLTRQLVITPDLIVLLLFANDFVTMAIATDRVTPAATPQRWHVQQLFALAASLALVLLVEAGVVLWLSETGPLHLSSAQIPTVIFLMLVFSGQATVYVVRESRAFWRSRPSNLLLTATGADVVVVSLLAIMGILMAPVPVGIVLLIALLALFFMLLLDVLKQALERQRA